MLRALKAAEARGETSVTLPLEQVAQLVRVGCLLGMGCQEWDDPEVERLIEGLGDWWDDARALADQVEEQAVHCYGCGAAGDVAVYVFEHRDGRLTDQPLCRRCAPSTPMLFEDWREWASEQRGPL